MQPATLAVLERANLPPAQARAISEAVEIEIVAHSQTLTTKLDLAELRRDLEVRIESLRGDLRAEIHGIKGELARWVVLCILGQTAAAFAWANFVVNHTK